MLFLQVGHHSPSYYLQHFNTEDEDSKYEIRVIEDYIDTFHSGDQRSGKWRDHIFVGQKLEDYIEVKV